MGNLDKYADVFGPVFNVKNADDANNPRRYFTLKTATKGYFISVTLWDNSHGHVKIKDGDWAIVSGKLTTKESGDKVYRNVSAFRIAVINMDEGVREDRPSSNDAEGVADEEDAL